MVGVILSGLYTAGSLILSAQGVFPNWPWQLHCLIGFIIFAGIMVWTIVDKQSDINNLKSGRPELTLGKTMGVNRKVDERTSEIKIEFNLFFRNIGTKAAHKFHSRIGYAQDSDVSKFKLLNEKTSVNRIDCDNDFEVGESLSGIVKYIEKDGKKIVSPVITLSHCMVSYSDSPSNGKLDKEEWWFSYRADQKYLGIMSEKQKTSLEPYVRKAYGE